MIGLVGSSAACASTRKFESESDTFWYRIVSNFDSWGIETSSTRNYRILSFSVVNLSKLSLFEELIFRPYLYCLRKEELNFRINIARIDYQYSLHFPHSAAAH